MAAMHRVIPSNQVYRVKSLKTDLCSQMLTMNLVRVPRTRAHTGETAKQPWDSGSHTPASETCLFLLPKEHGSVMLLPLPSSTASLHSTALCRANIPQRTSTVIFFLNLTGQHRRKTSQNGTSNIVQGMIDLPSSCSYYILPSKDWLSGICVNRPCIYFLICNN